MRIPKRRGRTPAVHMQLGRRYERAELTRAHRSSRSRKAASLLHSGLDAVHERYDGELDREMLEALHDAVVRLIRPEVTTSWTEEDARRRALEIARSLMEEPLPET